MTELDPAGAAWLKAAQAASAEIARLTEIRDRAIEHIQAEMGDSETATIDGRPAVTWAWSQPSKRLDKKALEADHGPEFVARYLVEAKAARPFRIVLEESS
jgi:hypothetical protein